MHRQRRRAVAASSVRKPPPTPEQGDATQWALIVVFGVLGLALVAFIIKIVIQLAKPIPVSEPMMVNTSPAPAMASSGEPVPPPPPENDGGVSS